MAFPSCEEWVINFTIGWKDYTLLNTFYSLNVNNIIQSAGNSVFFSLLFILTINIFFSLVLHFYSIESRDRVIKLRFICKILKLFIFFKKDVERGSSETIRENSFDKFKKSYLYFYGKPFEQKDN
jgi:DNA integrity scanning protein DisA with diadenylate cyclase activity